MSHRVLLVEDDPDICFLVATNLRLDGWDVVTADDGAAAWRLLQEQSFDLVHTDVELPSMSGLELLARVRADGRLRDLPVIVATGSPLEHEARAIDAGATAFVSKPYSIAGLRALLAELVAHAVA